MERWFKIEEHIQELRGCQKDDRRFYSKNIMPEISGRWREWLSAVFVSLGKDMHQVIDGRTYKQGREPYSELVRIEWGIQRNLVEILANNFVAQCVSLYMSIYRETYADVACILTAGISPIQYEQAFRHSDAMVSVSENVQESDRMRAIRIHIVAKTVADCDGADYAEEWKKYSKEHDFRERYGVESQIGASCGERRQEDMIRFFDTDLDSFERITKNCSDKLWKRLRESSGFKTFREIIKGMSIVNILNGKVYEELQNLNI